MNLLLDACMQCSHTGSYQLAEHFSQQGGLLHVNGESLRKMMIPILRMVLCMEKVFLADSSWAAFGQKPPYSAEPSLAA
jgi:hypothetical protein